MKKPIRRKDIPPQRRREILDAAAALFAQSGYHGVTVDAIAQRAGISKGNLYWYFSSKQEIIHQLFEYLADPLFTPMQQILEKDAPPRDKLRDFARGCFDTAEANPDAVRLLWQIAMQPQLKELISYDYTNWMRPGIDILAPCFADIGDPHPRDTASFYIITLDALMGSCVIGSEIFDKEKILAVLEERFIDCRRDHDG